MFCPGDGKTCDRPKVKRNVSSSHSFNSSAPTSSKSPVRAEMKEVTVSLNKLSWNSIEKFSPKGQDGKTAREEGLNSLGKGTRGVTRDRGSRGGCAAAKQEKGGWEAKKVDWGGRWEKVKGGWGRGKSRGGWNRGRGQRKKSSEFDWIDDDMSPDFVLNKKKNFTKTYNKVHQASSVYTQPDQKLRGTQQNFTQSPKPAVLIWIMSQTVIWHFQMTDKQIKSQDGKWMCADVRYMDLERHSCGDLCWRMVFCSVPDLCVKFFE